MNSSGPVLPSISLHPVSHLELEMREVIEGMEEFVSEFGLSTLSPFKLGIDEFEILENESPSPKTGQTVIPFQLPNNPE